MELKEDVERIKDNFPDMGQIKELLMELKKDKASTDGGESE